MLNKIKTLLTKIEIMATTAHEHNVDFKDLSEYDVVKEMTDMIQEANKKEKPILRVVK